MSDSGRKDDGGKLRYDLLPVLALEDVVKGLTFGTIKYDDDNWIKVPEGRKRYIAGAMRHIADYRKGVMYDPESGVHHLSAAIDNLMFIVEKDLRGWEDVGEAKDSHDIQPDGWIAWSGGDCPVEGSQKVIVRFRDGDELLSTLAGEWDWCWTTGFSGSEIVAYRVVKG